MRIVQEMYARGFEFMPIDIYRAKAVDFQIIDGKLMAKKKYRGKLDGVIPKLLKDFAEKYSLKKDSLYFIWSPGLSDENKCLAEKVAAECGFQSVSWMKTGCVITCHGGPGCIGIVGFSEEK